MASEWLVKTLGQVCEKITDGSHQSPKSVDAGKPMASVKDLRTYGVELSTARHISEEDFDKLVKQGCKPIVGDVLIAKDGNSALDTVCTVDNPLEAVLLSSVAILRPDQRQIDSSFLKYYFMSAETINYLKHNFISGAAIPRVILKDFKKADITIPPLPEQKSIAHVLRALDDRIELNRRMNETLEGMAQALFKSWFVDFDPVIDNALVSGKEIPEELSEKAQARAALGDKRKPLPEAIRSLFPDEFTYSDELGWIPQGWENVKIGDCKLEIESGKRPKGGIDKNLNRGVPSVGAESICPIGFFDYSKVKFVTEKFASTAKKGWVKPFDVALYKDGGKPGQFMPRVSLYGNSFPFEQFMVNEHVFLLRSEMLGPYFLFFTVSSPSFLDQLIAKGSAKAAQPGLNQGEVKDTKFLFPGQDIAKAFNRLIAPHVTKQHANGLKAKTLAALRDNLLPKLLSGELRIPDAEKMVEEVN